jgi:hypothetical protein
VAGMRARAATQLLDEAARPQPASAADNLRGLVFTALIADSVRAGAGMVGHHVGRALKRRAHGMAPGLVPATWSA